MTQPTFDLDALASMSDEELIQQEASLEEASVVATLNQQEESADEEESQEDAEATSEDDEVSEEEVINSEEDETADEESDDADDEDAEETSDKTSETFDAEEQLAKLFSPFKANGGEMSVKSIDEAITLMSMGANYNKKMHVLKPHLQIIKTLEKNELLDEDNLSFAIELAKGNQQAIEKLLVDKGINPLDLNTEDVSYSPVKHTTSESEINFNEVIERIQDTPTFKDTIDLITEKWDSSSKEFLVGNPEYIANINAHKANGIFDVINAEVNRQRALGQLPSTISDFKAYETVGEKLAKDGTLQAFMQGREQPAPKKVTPKVVPKDNDAKKKKLATPKSSSKPKRVASLDELAKLSDADFEKLLN